MCIWERGRQSACVYIRYAAHQEYAYMRDIKWAVCMYNMWKRCDIHRINWACIVMSIYTQHNSVCHCALYDVFTNSCSPPAESSPHIECTVKHQDHLYAPWAPSGRSGSLLALYKPTGVIIFGRHYYSWYWGSSPYYLWCIVWGMLQMSEDWLIVIYI